MTPMRLRSPASPLFTQPFIQGADQRKPQRSASLAFVRGIHRSPVNSPHKGPATRKMFPFDDVIMMNQHSLHALLFKKLHTISCERNTFARYVQNNNPILTWLLHLLQERHYCKLSPNLRNGKLLHLLPILKYCALKMLHPNDRPHLCLRGRWIQVSYFYTRVQTRAVCTQTCICNTHTHTHIYI